MTTNPLTALLFAGQGAQYVGMGRDLADAIPECAALLRQANEVLGYDLTRLCFEGPLDELVKSQHCQPAIFAVSMACYQALKQRCPAFQPAFTAGLSLGEWTALSMAGVISFEDGLRILAARGRFMQESCEERAGGMLSVIGLAPDALENITRQAGVEIANLNSSEQTVLSGPVAGIAAAEKLAQAAGAKRVIPLTVAGAYHSSLMAGAAAKLEKFLAPLRFNVPCIPVMSGVTARPHGTPEDIKRAMVRQVTSPVQWLGTVQWLQQHGVQAHLECGPGRVLSGLVKRIHAGAALMNVQDLPSLEKTVSAWQCPPAG